MQLLWVDRYLNTCYSVHNASCAAHPVLTASWAAVTLRYRLLLPRGISYYQPRRACSGQLNDDGARRGRRANDILHTLQLPGRHPRAEVLCELVEQLHIPLLEVALQLHHELGVDALQ